MMLIDTHTHLYASEFDDDREQVLARARGVGVERLLLPAIDSESHHALFDLCGRHPGTCIPMMGLHPTSVNDNPCWRDELGLVERYLASPPDGLCFCAVGEIGLDFYWSTDFQAEQCEALRHQIELALRYRLPIVMHVRDAWKETLALMHEFDGRGVRGVFHAFSGDEAIYRELKACGDFCFGVGGVVTFKKSPLVEVVRSMDPGDILLETDAPYLTPIPHRGKRNESAYVGLICAKVAEIKGLTAEYLAATTSANALRLFALPLPSHATEV